MKAIAILCDYIVKPSRIGGMDRFFRLFDSQAKKMEYEITWFFAAGSDITVHENLNIVPPSQDSVEQQFLNFVSKNDSHFDVVVTHFLDNCNPFHSKLKNGLASKVIVVNHNSQIAGSLTIKKKIKNRLKGFLYGNYIDQYIGVCKYSAGLISKNYGRKLEAKTRVIYNGIDVDATLFKSLPLNEENKGLKLIIVAHLVKEKGVEEAIRAVSQLENNNDLKLDIYGEGPLKNYLNELIIEKNLENQIALKGGSSKINQLFKDYDYLVLPTHMECFNLTILESLAANVPVITTRVGGNEEIVEDYKNGFLFEAKNIDALTHILQNIIDKRIKINHLTRPLIKEKYSLDRVVSEHLKYLQ